MRFYAQSDIPRASVSLCKTLHMKMKLQFFHINGFARKLVPKQRQNLENSKLVYWGREKRAQLSVYDVSKRTEYGFERSSSIQMHGDSEMKIFLLLLLLVVRGPLLCEENSLLGYRLDWNNSKGNVSLKCLERSRKKRFSLSVHLIHTKAIGGFSKFGPDRHLYFLPKRYCVRSC